MVHMVKVKCLEVVVVVAVTALQAEGRRSSCHSNTKNNLSTEGGCTWSEDGVEGLECCSECWVSAAKYCPVRGGAKMVLEVREGSERHGREVVDGAEGRRVEGQQRRVVGDDESTG
ncbi:hypothetical protein E2C01_018347 [Portunus trituberculatus]|uniref:Secreted protein n=1 Tax=Portunus trituberculatus TaxID=210409 RepID=A0A5B7DU90_PORTR|nr:hypothetical protein [Portunus trituberculatus]